MLLYEMNAPNALRDLPTGRAELFGDSMIMLKKAACIKAQS